MLDKLRIEVEIPGSKSGWDCSRFSYLLKDHLRLKAKINAEQIWRLLRMQAMISVI